MNKLFSIAEADEWVDHFSFEHPEPADDPLRYLLIDYQSRVTDEAIYRYSRIATEINDSSRVEAHSQLVIELDPESEHVVFHSSEIYRDGEVIDALDEYNIEVYQRETQLEHHVITNRQSCVLTVDDLRPGDVLVQSRTIVETVSEHPLYGRFFRDIHNRRWHDPALHQRMRVLNHSSHEITVQRIDSENEIDTNTSLASGAVHETELHDISPRIYRNALPARYWPPVEVATRTSSWEEITSYMLDYYHTELADERAELALALQELLPELDISNPRDDDVLQVIKLVQNDIRYRSHTPGSYSHLPRPAATVLKKRAGDCKDKSNLLVSLLDILGIEAYLALVNTGLYDGIAVMHPSPWLFNHMIVQFEHNGSSYFVDATLKKQGGALDKLAQPPFRLALVLKPGNTELSDIPRSRDDVVLDKAHILDLRRHKGEDATITVNRGYWARRADNMRYYFESNGMQKAADDAEQWIKDEINASASVAAGIAIKENDLNANHLLTQERYVLDDPHEDKQRYEISTDFYQDYLFPEDQNTPAEINSDGIMTHRIEVLYGYPPDTQEDEFTLKNKWFEYSDTIKIDETTLVFEMRLTPFADYVAADELAELHADAQALRRRSVSIFPARVEKPKSFWSTGKWHILWWFLAMFGLIKIARFILESKQ